MGTVKLTSVNWWIQTAISVFVVLLIIWAMKKVAKKVDIPVVSDVIAEA